MRARSLALGLTFASVLAFTPAHADEAKDKSRAEFKRGVALVHQNDYAGARTAFAEAYRLYPHPSILLNLGIAEWKVGEFVTAEDSLTKFIAGYGDASAEDVESARAALRDVRTHLGTLHLLVQTANAKAFLDDAPLTIEVGKGQDIRVPVGDHTLRVEADGDAPFRKNLHLNAADPDMESVTLQSWNNGSGTPPPPTTDSGTKPAPDATSDDGSTRHTVGLSLAIFGGAAIAFGAFSGIEALSKSSAYNDPNGQHLPEDKTNGLTYRTLADVSFLVGLASGGIGAYFLLTKPEAAASSSTPSASSGPTASIGVVPGGLSFRSTF